MNVIRLSMRRMYLEVSWDIPHNKERHRLASMPGNTRSSQLTVPLAGPRRANGASVRVRIAHRIFIVIAKRELMRSSSASTAKMP